MAAHVMFDNSTVTAVHPDESKWTELQQILFMLGIWDGVPDSPVKVRELPDRNWLPNEEWRKGMGLLNDHPDHDTAKMKADEREWEEEHDARKFGYSRPV